MSPDPILVNDSKPQPSTIATDILLERTAIDHPWQSYRWEVIGVVTGGERKTAGLEQVNDLGDTQQFLFSGLQVALYEDECESYYHNLKSPNPGCFVVARRDENDLDAAPEPFVITLSFDEAHAYQEGDDLVFAVPIPAEMYRWTEAYVIDHYAPEKRKKRKRKDWKHGAGEAVS